MHFNNYCYIVLYINIFTCLLFYAICDFQIIWYCKWRETDYHINQIVLISLFNGK